MNTAGLVDSEVRIVVTDSGLGGLSVAALLVEKFKKAHALKRVRVIYFNCRPSDAIGFDPMETFEQRQRVFSNALYYIEETFSPAAIIIACNTLSVFYDQTDFSRHTETRVLGIVESGVDLISETLRKNETLRVILFATPTTIESGVYQKKLGGFELFENRLFFQACPWLVLAIEASAEGPETLAMIEGFVEEVLDRESLGSVVLGASLNCTHFGYSESLFRKAFKKCGVNLEGLLSPNERLVDDFLATLPKDVCSESRVDVEVVSHAFIPPVNVTSVYPVLQKLSEQTAEAFQRHHHTPLRFNIQ